MSQIDFTYLESFTAGDTAIVREVLELFRQQAGSWLARLAAPSEDWRELAHLIKGSAKGIGANALGDLAGEAELKDASMAPALVAAVQAALAEVDGYLAARG